MIDHRLYFRDHVRYASRKAAMTAAALGSLMPNVGESRMPARRLLETVTKSTLLYAASIWSCVTSIVSYLENAGLHLPSRTSYSLEALGPYPKTQPMHL